MRNCKQCNIQTKSDRHAFCSTKCSRLFYYEMIKCITCGCIFEDRKKEHKKYCSHKCAVTNPERIEQQKSARKILCQERYGVDAYTQTDEFKEKTRITNIKRYGVEFPQQSQVIRGKSIKTLIDKFGVDNAAKSDIVLEKIKNTNLIKYGFKTILQTPDFNDKAKKIKLDKYGDENYNNQEQLKATCMDKYGVDNVSKVDTIRDKISHNLKSNFLDTIFNGERLGDNIPLFTPNDYLTGSPKDKYQLQCKVCHLIYDAKIMNGIIPKCPTCYPPYSKISKFQRRVYEHVLKTHLDALLEVHLPAINKYADILIPSLNKIIECNGDYWHCNPENYKADYYHKRIHLTAQEIWNNDSVRINILESAGYIVDVVWEKEVNNYINNTQI